MHYVRCGCWLRNPMIRNQTLATPDLFKENLRPDPDFFRYSRPIKTKKWDSGPKMKKCYKTCPEGSDFEKNLRFRRCFSRRIFPEGSRPGLVKSIFRTNKKFSGDSRAPPRFLESARLFQEIRMTLESDTDFLSYRPRRTLDNQPGVVCNITRACSRHWRRSRRKNGTRAQNRKNAIKHAQKARALMIICVSGAVFRGASF